MGEFDKGYWVGIIVATTIGGIIAIINFIQFCT